MKFRVKRDCIGSKLIHLHSHATLATTGSLKKGEIVELVDKPKQFPAVFEVRRSSEKNTTYQIVKEDLERVE